MYIYSKQYARIIDTDKFDYLETAGNYLQAVRVVDVTTTEDDEEEEEYPENVNVEVIFAEYADEETAERVLQQIFKAFRDCQKTFDMPE